MTSAKDSTVSIEDGRGEGPKTLRQKLRDHYRRGPEGRAGSKSAGVARGLFLFQAFTQIYVTLNYLIPFVFGDLDPFWQYCLKVFACHICLMSVANWVCILCYSNVYQPTKDRPDLDIHVFHDASPPERFQGNRALHHEPLLETIHHSNGHAVIDVSEKGGLPWKFCKRCNFSTPPRTHHCKFCHKCMLRRDHHCHMVGACIGHWNQRYFIVLAGYGIVVGYLGAYMTISYLRYHHPHDQTFWVYFLPATVVKMMLGEISLLQTLLIFHAYMLCVFGPICNIYLLTQLSTIFMGKTLHELLKKVPVKATSSVKDNFRVVFGDYWLINFLFPAQIIFKQECDGTHYEGVKLVLKRSVKQTEKRTV